MFTAWSADGKRCVTIEGPVRPELLDNAARWLSGDEVDRVRKLRADGMLYREISDEVGCSVQTVGDVCRGTGAYKALDRRATA